MGADGANAEPATQAYCEALLNQEKSLEELQKHLLKTEELFRESVKRKNQQLDLMQTELSRLKTSAPASDEVAPAHERALSELASGEFKFDLDAGGGLGCITYILCYTPSI